MGPACARIVRRPPPRWWRAWSSSARWRWPRLATWPPGSAGRPPRPPGSDSALGNALLAGHFPQTAANPTFIVLRLRQPVWASPAAVAAAERQLAADPQFTAVSGPFDANGTALTAAQYTALHAAYGPPRALTAAADGKIAQVTLAAFQSYRASGSYVSADGDTVSFATSLAAGNPAGTPAEEAVPAIRADAARAARAAGASAFGATGQAPFTYDVAQLSDSDLRTVIPIAIAVIAVLLALVMRSLIAPLYLIVSVVLSYFSALGLTVLVFIKAASKPGLTFILPFLLFMFLLALGEDYNILVMTRIGRRRTGCRCPRRSAGRCTSPAPRSPRPGWCWPGRSACWPSWGPAARGAERPDDRRCRRRPRARRADGHLPGQDAAGAGRRGADRPVELVAVPAVRGRAFTGQSDSYLKWVRLRWPTGDLAGSKAISGARRDPGEHNRRGTRGRVLLRSLLGARAAAGRSILSRRGHAGRPARVAGHRVHGGARRAGRPAAAQDRAGLQPEPDSSSARWTTHMLNSDPPDHERLRRLVNKAFTARRVERLRPRITAITAELLDAMPTGREVDLLASFAFPLPITVICELLGIPVADRDDFRAWSATILSNTAAPEVFMADATAMVGYFRALLAAKRRQPADDLLSALILTRDEGDGLREDELISMLFLLLVAGHETTVNLIASGMLALLLNPGELARLRADPGLIGGAVEELLRYMNPVNHATFRCAAEPIEIGGAQIGPGEAVFVALSGANRDPARYADPERLDLDRDSAGHLAFGHGIHYCLGAPLARLEAEIAFGALLDRFGSITLAVPAGTLRWRPSSLIHGLESLPVRLAA